VHRVLTNTTYLGRIRWRDQDFLSTRRPLIDQSTFGQAQAILIERGEDASRRRGNRSDFLLSGVVRCGHCGRAYIGMSARGKGGLYHYYAYTARQKYGPKACQGQRISREKLETAVLHQLTGIYRDGPQAKALLRILIAELRVNSKADIQPTYRIIAPDRTHTAGVCATSEKVETVGIEPTQRSRRE
jgi:site-specific DNA recombinase